MSRPPKIKRPTKSQYRLAAMEKAAHFCPPIRPCADCGWPVISGYCCGTCGSNDPSRAKEDQ